ncbi:phasin family protein [Dokdonella sp. MW10]|uniref:phasin family protein n=1 Tax=Dokdonella sp. MW10 TaxID=2992926 RepID=UPI003F823608
MTKQIKARRAGTVVAKDDVARKLWLAGLGAFSLARKQALATFDVLAAEGESLRARGGTYARSVARDAQTVASVRFKPVRERLVAVRAQAEAALERGTGRVLSYAGVPSKADVDALIARVDALSKRVRARR